MAVAPAGSVKMPVRAGQEALGVQDLVVGDGEGAGPWIASTALRQPWALLGQTTEMESALVLGSGASP